MDHQRDSGWIEPLEATALSADEKTEIETQTSVSFEGNMKWTRMTFYSVFAGGNAGAPSKGGIGGCRTTPP